MVSIKFLNFAFLCLVALSLRLPHQASAASRGRFLLADNHGTPFPHLPGGVCFAVARNGYKCEEFVTVTNDGYLLSVQRIQKDRTGGGGESRQPVLLQHGLLVDGMEWVAASPKVSLAMTMADKGFDVWVSNIRGTRFSSRHTRLTSKDRAFWNWTWDDLVDQDLPAIIELVFKQTGREIHYVGHAMGALMALASLSEGKLKNVQSAVMLSPIAHLSHLKSPVTIAAAAFLGEIALTFGLAEFNPKGPIESAFMKGVCALAGVEFNEMTINIFSGNNCCVKRSVLQNVMENVTQPTATKNLLHFAQTIRDGRNLTKFDFGNENDNMVHYGQKKPPFYDLSKIPHDFPLFISYGGEDAMADAQDVSELLNIDLKSHKKKKLKVHFIKEYAHLDFVMADNAKKKLYGKIISFIKKHNREL